MQEIAGELYLSANTVKFHIRHLYDKLEVHQRSEAVEHARAWVCSHLRRADARRPAPTTRRGWRSTPAGPKLAATVIANDRRSS